MDIIFFFLLFSLGILAAVYKTVYDLFRLYRRDIISHFQGKGFRDIELSEPEIEDVDDHFPDAPKNYFWSPPLFNVRYIKVKYADISGQRRKAIVWVKSWYFKKATLLVKDLN